MRLTIPQAGSEIRLMTRERPPLTRRQFLSRTASATAGLATLTAGCATPPKPVEAPYVMTVLGPIAPELLGVTLPHEHVLLDFIGPELVRRDRYSQDEVVEVALPHLQRLKDFGGQSLVECTPAYLGRDPRLLKRLATEAQLHLLTNTGFYGAGQNRFLPPRSRTQTVDEIAFRWLAEWRDGIDGTGVRPGFIKIGVDGGELSDLQRKLVRAAARTHRYSGLVISAHTGDGTAALDELRILREENVAGSALIWGHAQNEANLELHRRAAQEGAWIEFDHLGPQTVGHHVELVQHMKFHRLLHRVLVSHDGGWFEVGKPGGGEFRSYDTLFTEFIPALKTAGFSDPEIHQLLVHNPREAFTVRVRET